MYNKKRNNKSIIDSIDFTWAHTSAKKPYDIGVEGTFVLDGVVKSFTGNLYVSAVPINQHVTIFGEIELRTPDIDKEEIIFDFNMHESLRELPHAVTYGLLYYGSLNEEAVITYPEDGLNSFWQKVDENNAKNI
jgi:hypothetical protein